MKKSEENMIDKLHKDLEYLKKANKEILKDISERKNTFKTLNKKATEVKIKSFVFDRNVTRVANKIKGKYVKCVSYGVVALIFTGVTIFLLK